MATKKTDQVDELPEDQAADETEAQAEAPAPKSAGTRHGTSGTITINAKGEVQ